MLVCHHLCDYKHWLDVCLPVRCLVLKRAFHCSQEMEAVGQPASAEGEAHIGRPRHRPRGHAGDTESAQSFYARQLMQPEWLTDVPVDLASHWCSPGLVVFGSSGRLAKRYLAAVDHQQQDAYLFVDTHFYKLRPSRYALPRPEGQRCLVVASEGCTVSRTRAGRLLHTFPSALPGGARGGDAGGSGPCILDCVFHEPAGTYFVQDIMCWKGYTLYDCSAEFRLFWLHTKLAEGGASSARSKRHRYPFVPLTAYACDPGGRIHKVVAQQLSRAGEPHAPALSPVCCAACAEGTCATCRRSACRAARPRAVCAGRRDPPAQGGLL